MRAFHAVVLLVALLLTGLSGAEAGEPVRVLSFNIRYGTANDGADRWENRRDKVVETIRDLDADVVGLQESLSFQIRELLEALPRYAAVGVHRDDGLLEGEGAAVFYDRTRYTLDSSGTFWLSGTPDVAGSNTWGAACNRTCTWVRLVDLGSGEAFYVYNTHFDHKGQRARRNSVGLILERIDQRATDDPFLVMGDLNADEQSDVIAGLLAGADGWDLVDTYREHHPDAKAGTYTAFKTNYDGGHRKIDYVLRGPGLRTLRADIDRRMIGGRYPSDHFPVWADVEILGE